MTVCQARTAVIVARLGPYHVARLAAAGRCLGRESVIALEVAHESREYAWDPVRSAGFVRRTLITEQEYEDVPASELRRRVRVALDEAMPVAVAVNGWAFPEARAAIAWCRRNRRAAVIMSESQAHDAPRTWFRETPKRAVLAHADAALVGGERHADYLVQLGLPRERIALGYDAVDNEYFRTGAAVARASRDETRRRLGVPPRYLLASARFIPKKNLLRLVEAYASYRRHAGERAWDLVVLGDGPERPRLEARRRELGLEASVWMPGFKQYGELADYYGLAKAFILPSTTEQWGLVVNEAMASGLPVLVSATCGSAELVRSGVSGYHFDPESVADIARVMVQITEDEPKLASIGAAAARDVERVSPEAFAQGLERAIELGKRHAATRKPSLLTPPSLWF